MPDQPIPISDISDPAQIRVKLLSSGREVHAPMSAVASAAIHGMPAKTTPVDADEFPLADSAASFAAKKITWANIKAAIWAALGALINGGTGKSTPVDADMFAIADSAASNATKKLTWADLKATFVATANTWSVTQTFSAAAPSISVTGGTIRFPATQVASSGANDLDDYEEGTWTPALTFGGGSTGITYSFRSGTYVKIGLEVFFELQFNLTSKGTSTGNMLITGLPFTPSVNSGASVGQFGTFASSLNLQAGIGTTGVSVYAMGLAASSSLLNDTNFTNTSFIIISGHYRV